MPLVMLKRNWPSHFRRTLRAPDGSVSRVLEFAPGEMHDVTAEELAQLADDLGAALQPCQADDKGRPKPVDLTYEEVIGQAVAASEPDQLAPPADPLSAPASDLPPSNSPEPTDAENPGGRSRRRR